MRRWTYVPYLPKLTLAGGTYSCSELDAARWKAKRWLRLRLTDGKVTLTVIASIGSKWIRSGVLHDWSIGVPCREDAR